MSSMRRGDRIVIMIMLITMFVSLSAYWLTGRSSGDLTAVVKVDGKPVRRINLSTIKEPVEFTIRSGPDNQQYDIIEVERGRIRVREANCPDQIVVQQGWVSRPGLSAICVPHRLVIQVESNRAYDVDAVVM